jgi:hypothetical protein
MPRSARAIEAALRQSIRLPQPPVAPKFSAMIEQRPISGHIAAQNLGRFWYRQYMPAA